uniref:Uncharacterized protein n=1 Tax=Hyaloperonospora arabidopsidis (strain Emoy2) TaxID=559515 RepID=M4BAJ1_HYAAE
MLIFEFAAFCAPASIPSYAFRATEEIIRNVQATAAVTSAKGIAAKLESMKLSYANTINIKNGRANQGSPDSDDDSSDSSDSSDSKYAGFAYGDVFSALSTTQSKNKNWIGKFLRTTSTTACYRKAHIAKTCPLGFDAKLGMCWAQCPLTYPIECGMECIRRNDNCALEVITKVSGVAQAVFSVATYDAYGKFKLMAKGIRIAYMCSKEIMGLVKALSKYVRTVRVSAPDKTSQQLLALMYQTDNVVFDIPVTIASCLGIRVDDKTKFADRMLNTIMLVLKEIISQGEAITTNWLAFTTFMKKIGLGGTLLGLETSDITSLRRALKSNSTCGYDMKRMLDRTWILVAEMRRKDPTISEDGMRVAMSESNLALYDIPIVTNNCMTEMIAESDVPEAYATRETLRKGFGGIMEDLITSGTSNNGTFLTARQYANSIADKVGSFYAIWEKKNIGGALFEFFQPVCGPTEFVGEIDDGTAEEALGLKTVDDAFEYSIGTWTKIGDGSVTITFLSTDKKDVTVNIKSGGDKIDEVKVAAGTTVTWTSTVKALEGKTLYLDRWRPGFLGLPGLDDGSLLLWVPRSRQGGKLQLLARLNDS